MIIIFTGTLISTSIQTLVDKADVYESHIDQLIQNTLNWLEGKNILLSKDVIGAHLDDLPIKQTLSTVSKTLLDMVSNSFLILIFVIYLLMGKNPTARRGPIFRKIENSIKKYIAIKSVLSVVTGLLVGFFLYILGVELAIVFGVLAFILNFIPSIGSVIATLLPLPLILLDPNSSAVVMIGAIVLPGTVQMVVGNILEPKLLGDSLELHPITVLLSLIFWGMLWGVSGMLLAAPITAVLKILFENIEITKPLADLLAGRVPEETTEDPPKNLTIPTPPPSQDAQEELTIDAQEESTMNE